ncbi:sodium:calcium antiporter [Aureibacter tunicatorum]|uniref:Cation:H+ antiporter n=1 Tax=Aureibacter tunicatorum TaxID=866807 RepID=A0AAE3XS16_9BACT|nr:hypothetical protein [Aureibacter tunicatorum]MDR6240409.1 cation:H+ antiporter [Aureibacter tunicatorum]BDD05711.1 sodium/hydrogen exchanger [Aureibacter tunicatorum]
MLQTTEKEVSPKPGEKKGISVGLILGFLIVLLALPTVINFYAPGMVDFWTHGVPHLAQSIIVIVACCLIIWKASDGFETASDYIGDQLGMEAGVKGATINAIGSSLPELFTTFFFLVVQKDATGFAGGIGTTAGSAVFNAMIIPAAVILSVSYSLKRGVTVDKRVILRDGLFLIFAELLLVVLLNSTEMTWLHGVILMLIYGGYIAILKFFKISNADGDSEEEEEEEDEYVDGSIVGRLKSFMVLNIENAVLGGKAMSKGLAWSLLAVATVIIGLACHLLAEACVMLGEALNVAPFIIAIIFAAAATSVPDTFISIKDAKKGNYNDAVANALGSNIFDICFALGFPLAIYCFFNGNIPMGTGEASSFVGEFRVLLLIFTVLAFFIYYFGNKMGKSKAFMLFGLYGAFLLYTLAYVYAPDSVSGIRSFLASSNDFFSQFNILN